MKNITKIAALAVVAVALTQTAGAIPVSGNIGFSGSAVLNTGDVGTASQVNSWGTTVVNAESGTFASFAGGIPLGTPVALAAVWTFNSGPLNSFWQVGGFNFDLTSSTVFSLGGGFLNVLISGIVTGNGFDATAFAGSFQVSNPSANGATTFTERLSFNSVPDGSSTVLLLGAALSGMVLIKRKFLA